MENTLNSLLELLIFENLGSYLIILLLLHFHQLNDVQVSKNIKIFAVFVLEFQVDIPFTILQCDFC